jgi:hypothetical protein
MRVCFSILLPGITKKLPYSAFERKAILTGISIIKPGKVERKTQEGK